MTDHNTIMTSVANLVNGMTFATAVNNSMTWKLVSNRLKLWADVDPSQQPAAFIVTHREIDEYRGIGLVRRRLELQLWCYTRSDNSPGAPQLDTILTSLETALLAAVDDYSTNSVTFGKQVYWCRIEGRVFKDPGDIDNQTLMIIPIVIEMP